MCCMREETEFSRKTRFLTSEVSFLRKITCAITDNNGKILLFYLDFTVYEGPTPMSTITRNDAALNVDVRAATQSLAEIMDVREVDSWIIAAVGGDGDLALDLVGGVKAQEAVQEIWQAIQQLNPEEKAMLAHLIVTDILPESFAREKTEITEKQLARTQKGARLLVELAQSVKGKWKGDKSAVEEILHARKRAGGLN